MKPHILIASPVRQKPYILAYFLTSLQSLNQDELVVDFLFIDDNDDKQSTELLASFQSKNERVKIIKNDQQNDIYMKDDKTHYWTDSLIEKVAKMKDSIIEHAIEFNYDGLFLIDSDLMLYPSTLQNLWDEQKDIISNVFWTEWQKDIEALPQVWMMDEYTLYEIKNGEKLEPIEIANRTAAFIKQLKVPGVYEVGGLGACTLISRKALLKGVRFKQMKNLSFWGEDRHFCIRAAALDLQLFVDTRFPAFHIYRDSDLLGAQKFNDEILTEKKEKATVSLCMIVKNEEQVLARCLSSVQGLVDEIIIVDTGSSDKTKEIARQYTNDIYDFEWIDDFSKARNFSFSKATKDYILWLDADDILHESERLHFSSLAKELSFKEVDSVMMDYHLAFNHNGEPTYSLKRNRLVKRSCNFTWIGAVHEYLSVHGNIIQRNIAITHRKEKAYTDRNIKIYKQREDQGMEFSARDLFYYGNELKDHAMYEEAVEKYNQFLLTKQGWIEDEIAACLKVAECYEMLHAPDKQLQYLFKTLSYSLPRPECCCRLGARFLVDEQYDQAIYWYEQAIIVKNQPKQGNLIDHAAWTWLPYVQLAVCYERLGQYQKAQEYKELALQYNATK
ncbi:tetratricopeptide repeat-containing glycosyltransferase family 2 protein [Lysinibacillus sp. FSL W8-0992]|uniref:tetratricopeptide repeat-containing glycosyltransferase family 2 protein n=1 Tax=Lysinibacillus sp. FSL W8-0992 TaxID=2954643 RepID=UPI0030F9E1C1